MAFWINVRRGNCSMGFEGTYMETGGIDVASGKEDYTDDKAILGSEGTMSG